jgi:hypothetical protein
VFLAFPDDEVEGEKVANKVMYVQTMSVTQNDVLGYAKALVPDRG